MKKMFSRRRRSKVPVLVVLLFCVVMIVILAFFFQWALNRSAEEPVTPGTGETEGTPAVEPGTEPGSEEPSVQATEEPSTQEPVTEEPTQEPATQEPQTEPPTEPPTEPATQEPPTEPPTEPATKEPQTEPVIVQPNYNEELLNQVALKTGTAPSDYIDRLVFFGDSTTYGMKAYKVFGSRDTNQVWTPVSGTLTLTFATTTGIYNPNTGEELILADICAKEKPEYLVVTLGVNGVSFLDKENFKAEYENVIKTIRASSPDTKLILQSIYPIARSYEKQQSINNDKIQAANTWIVELAAAYNLPYLNTYSALVDAEGWLPETYQNGDGMHFNQVGFAVIIEYIRNHPYLG